MSSKLPSKKYVKFSDHKVLGAYNLGGEATWVKSFKKFIYKWFIYKRKFRGSGVEIPQGRCTSKALHNLETKYAGYLCLWVQRMEMIIPAGMVKEGLMGSWNLRYNWE